MNLNPLPPNLINLLNTGPVSLNREGTSGLDSGFADILTEALTTANQTDAIDKSSTLQFMMGETDDLSAILIDAQKAELALQFALQIRNKVIDAYNEVMRMSV